MRYGIILPEQSKVKIDPAFVACLVEHIEKQEGNTGISNLLGFIKYVSIKVLKNKTDRFDKPYSERAISAVIGLSNTRVADIIKKFEEGEK